MAESFTTSSAIIDCTNLSPDKRTIPTSSSQFIFKKYGNLPEWIQLTEEDHALIQRQWERSQEIRAIRESIPDWMDEMCESEIGENWDREIAALNEEAKVVLRVNTLKCSIDQLQDALNKQGIDSLRNPLYPTALILEKE